MSALSFSVSAKHLRELSKCFLYLLIICNLAQMWNAAFFLFLDSSKLLKFARRCRPRSCFLSPWFQAKRLSANNIPRQKYNQKHSVVLYTSWQQVCSCDGFLCHLNYLWKVKVWWCTTGIVIGLSCRGTGCYRVKNLPITVRINKEETQNVNALNLLLVPSETVLVFTLLLMFLLLRVSVKRKMYFNGCATTWALETKGYILHIMQHHSDIQERGLIGIKNQTEFEARKKTNNLSSPIKSL